MSQDWLAPTVVSSAIAGGVALATHLSSQRAKKSENREDIRTEAFGQAKEYYVDVITRQETELDEVRKQLVEVKRRLVVAEEDALKARSAIRLLRVDIEARDEQLADLRRSLARRHKHEADDDEV